MDNRLRNILEDLREHQDRQLRLAHEIRAFRPWDFEGRSRKHADETLRLNVETARQIGLLLIDLDRALLWAEKGVTL